MFFRCLNVPNHYGWWEKKGGIPKGVGGFLGNVSAASWFPMLVKVCPVNTQLPPPPLAQRMSLLQKVICCSALPAAALNLSALFIAMGMMKD